MMNQNSKSPSGTIQSNENSFGYYQSRVLQYTDIDEFFFQEIKFIDVMKGPVTGTEFAKLLHHRIKLMPGDRNIYALEYFIGGYRCYNSSFISSEQKIVPGTYTLFVLCFSRAFLLTNPVFDKSLSLIAVVENIKSYSSIVVLQECTNTN